MMKNTEKLFTKKAVCRKIFLHRYISRHELAELLGLDQRTVASHADELVKMRVVTREDVAEKQGRPKVYYRAGQTLFLGVYVYKNLYYSLCGGDLYQHDYGSVYYGDQDFDVDQACTVLDQAIAKFPRRTLMGIGMVYHYFNQPPARKKFFIELGKRLKARYCVDIIQAGVPSATLLSEAMKHDFFPFRTGSDACNSGIIHPADRPYLGLYVNDTVMPFTAYSRKEHEELLEGVMTHSMLLDTYRQSTGTVLEDIFDFRLKLSEDDPAALEIMRTQAAALSKAAVRLHERYELDKVFLLDVHLKTVEETRRLLRGAVPFDILSDSQIESLTAAVKLAVHGTIGGFLRT